MHFLLSFVLSLASDLLKYSIYLFLGVILKHLLYSVIHVNLHDLLPNLPL